MKCILYARKSTESEERQVQSLDDQLRIMRETAKRQGLLVVEEIAESRSAKIPNNRPGFNRMVELIERGSASAILVWHVDRLSRNPLDGGRLGQLLMDGKLELIQTPDRRYVSEDSPIFLAIESAVAAGYSQALSKNVLRGMESKAEKGWLPMKPPLGYRNNPWNRQIEPDPEDFAFVRYAWELVLTSGHGLREIARELECRFPGRPRMSNERLYRKLYELYRNPFYAGSFRFRGKLYAGKHEPLISPGEFEFVQRRLERATATPRPSKHEPLFLGMIRCAECGGPATVTRARKVGKNGTVHSYTYYHCTGHRGCRKRVVEEGTIKSVLTDFAKGIAIHPKLAEVIQRQIEAYFARLGRDMASTADDGSAQLEKLQRRLTTLTAMRMDGEIDVAEYLSAKATVVAEIGEVESRASKAESNVDQAKIHLGQLIASGVEAFACEADGTESNLRNLASRLTNSIYIRSRQVEIRLDSTLQKIASIKPPVNSSQSLDSNDFRHLPPIWYTNLGNLLETLCEEVLAEVTRNA